MKADPERPEQIAERIVNDAWIFYDERSELDRRKLRETIVAAIHAERAQTAQVERVAFQNGYYAGVNAEWNLSEEASWEEYKRSREAAQEDRSHE